MKRLAAPPQLTQYAMARTRESPFAKQMAAVPVTQPYSTHTNPLIAIEEYYHVRACVCVCVSIQSVCAWCVAGGDGAKAEKGLLLSVLMASFIIAALEAATYREQREPSLHLPFSPKFNHCWHWRQRQRYRR
jgi:hypothetical protein